MHGFSIEHLFAFIMFAVVSSITPGPNNIMIMSSGLNYGIRRSLPHLLGICLGFGFMVFTTGLGLHQLFVQYPLIQLVMKYLGAAYLLWLAIKIATSHSQPAEAASNSRPLTFIEAAIFQWVNPKAWVMALGALTAFLPTTASMVDVVVLAGIYVLVGTPCVAIWCVFGMALRQFLSDPVRLKWFNWATGLLLAVTIYPMVVS